MTLIRNIHGNGVFFTALEFFTYAFKTQTDVPLTEFQQRIVVGGLTGFVFQSSTYPFDTIKARMMEHRGTGNGIGNSGKLTVLEACQCIIRDHGVKGFFRGLGITLMKAVPINAAGITLLRYLQDYFGPADDTKHERKLKFDDRQTTIDGQEDLEAL